MYYISRSNINADPWKSEDKSCGPSKPCKKLNIVRAVMETLEMFRHLDVMTKLHLNQRTPMNVTWNRWMLPRGLREPLLVYSNYGHIYIYSNYIYTVISIQYHYYGHMRVVIYYKSDKSKSGLYNHT